MLLPSRLLLGPAANQPCCHEHAIVVLLLLQSPEFEFLDGDEDSADEDDTAFDYDGPIAEYTELRTGMLVAVWFSKPWRRWYIGQVMDFNSNRCVHDNADVEFEDGRCNLRLDESNYGANKNWVIPRGRSLAAAVATLPSNRAITNHAADGEDSFPSPVSSSSSGSDTPTSIELPSSSSNETSPIVRTQLS